MGAGMEGVAETRLTRQELLARSAAGLAVLALAPAGAVAAPRPGVTLRLVGFEGDDIAPALRRWTAAQRLVVQRTSVRSAGEMLEALGRGGPAADLLSFPLSAVRTLDESGALQPIDVDRISSFWGLDRVFLGKRFAYVTTNSDGKVIVLPTSFTRIGVTVAGPQRYRTLGDAVSAPGGRTVMIDAPSDNLALACHVLGLDMGRLPRDRLKEVSGLLSRVRRRSVGVVATVAEQVAALAGGDAEIAFATRPSCERAALAAGATQVTSLPSKREPAPVDVNLIAVAAGSAQGEAVTRYLDAILEARHNAAIAEHLTAGATVRKAVPLVTEANRATFPYGQLRRYLQVSPTFFDPPAASDRFVTQTEWLDAWRTIVGG